MQSGTPDQAYNLSEEAVYMLPDQHRSLNCHQQVRAKMRYVLSNALFN